MNDCWQFVTFEVRKFYIQYCKKMYSQTGSLFESEEFKRIFSNQIS